MNEYLNNEYYRNSTKWQKLQHRLAYHGIGIITSLSLFRIGRRLTFGDGIEILTISTTVKLGRSLFSFYRLERGGYMACILFYLIEIE